MAATGAGRMRGISPEPDSEPRRQCEADGAPALGPSSALGPPWARGPRAVGGVVGRRLARLAGLLVRPCDRSERVDELTRQRPLRVEHLPEQAVAVLDGLLQVGGALRHLRELAAG